MHLKSALAGMLLCCGSPAMAQQPGTVQYNTVLLPAHGAGDTQRAGATRWGALARTSGGALGWTVDGESKEGAEGRALTECASISVEPCRVVFTFFNGCAVFAASPQASTWSSAGRKSLEWHRKAALKECGSGCTVRREGCALPKR